MSKEKQILFETYEEAVKKEIKGHAGKYLGVIKDINLNPIVESIVVLMHSSFIIEKYMKYICNANQMKIDKAKNLVSSIEEMISDFIFAEVMTRVIKGNIENQSEEIH